MEKIGTYFLLSMFLLIVWFIPHVKSECNQYECSSIVSKCLLLGSCKCQPNDSECFQHCVSCMSTMFHDCCDCLNMCPKIISNDELPMKSQIGHFMGIPELFNMVINYDGVHDWTSIQMPIEDSLKEIIPNTIVDQKAVLEKLSISSRKNCSILYLRNCVTEVKCITYCQRFGAKKFRWFVNGCCQCIDSNCFGYGLNKDHCAACPILPSAQLEEQHHVDDITNHHHNQDYDNDNYYYDNAFEYNANKDLSNKKKVDNNNNDLNDDQRPKVITHTNNNDHRQQPYENIITNENNKHMEEDDYDNLPWDYDDY